MKKFNKFFVCIICLLLCAVTVVSPVSALTMTYTPSASYASGKYYTALRNVCLTGDQRTDIVAVANSQVGYTEGNNKSSLSGTAGGYNNYTEYGQWIGMQDMWCSMFVSWCANQAGISTKVVPKTTLCATGLTFFSNAGRAYSRAQVKNGAYTPKSGDIVYFKTDRNNSTTNHVGIVTGYSGGTLYTIEGNASNAVRKCSYSISNTTIVYICNPNYTSKSSTNNGGSYFPACSSSYTSIVNALNSIGVDSSFAYRKTIAAANGISGYSGTAAQNTTLLKLLKNGQLLKPGASAPATTAPALNTYTVRSSSGAKVRSGAGTSYAQKGGLAKGSVVYYDKAVNANGYTWYHIVKANTTSGTWGSWVGYWIANV